MVNEKVAQLVSHRDRDKVRVQFRPLIGAALHKLLLNPETKVLKSVVKSQFPDNHLPLSLINLELLRKLINIQGRGKWVNQKLLLSLGLVLSKL